jgi:hypothetical protein
MAGRVDRGRERRMKTLLLILLGVAFVAAVIFGSAYVIGKLAAWAFPKADGRTFLDDEGES